MDGDEMSSGTLKDVPRYACGRAHRTVRSFTWTWARVTGDPCGITGSGAAATLTFDGIEFFQVELFNY